MAIQIWVLTAFCASDPLDSPGRGPGVEDGLPQTLAEWIAEEGLTHFKVKLNGGNLGSIRVCTLTWAAWWWNIERVVSATQAKRRVRECFEVLPGLRG